MLQYRLLGPLEVADDGHPIVVPSSQQRLLLAMLLVEARRTVVTDALIEELWGDRLPSDPAAALRTQVSRLRHRLGAGADELVTDHVGYRLDVGEDCLDAEVFERLLADGCVDDALSLWRGPALGEFADRDFAAASAARFDELRLGARELRATNALAEGRARDAVADLQALISEQPDRERARELLMEALYRSGRPTDALTVYEAWRTELVEHGLEPGPAIVELERRIVQHRVPVRRASVPVPVSSFVGREHDLTAVTTMLGTARMITLCGTGGVGKTRLALELSRRLVDRYPDGLCFCDLGAFRRPSQVDRAIAEALGLPETTPRHDGDQLVEQLAGRRLLLVLDNCEHLLEAVARVVDRIVGHTVGITVLATSRARLAAHGEVIHPVEALDTEAAAELFIDRAQAIDPTFALDEQSVHQICERLDRLPLAIELAAACMRATTASELATALDDPLGLLTLGSHTTARHASLASVIDWSYERLSPEERAAFDRFAVFAGRVDADAATSVTGAPLGVLLRLVDRSLLTAHRVDVTQYSMLQTLRDYATARLDERDELDAARHEHAAWALDLAERAATHLSGPDEPGWAARVGRHLDELRAAHVWLVGREPLDALRLSAALHPWAFWRGRAEVFRMAEVAAASASSASALWPEVVASAAVGAWQRGDLAAAEAGAHAAGGHRRATEVLADVAFLRGDLDLAHTLFQEAAVRSQTNGDHLQVVWDLGSAALALHYSGCAVGDEPRRVLAIAEASGSPSARAFAHFVIGEIDESADDLRTAMEFAATAGSDFLDNLAAVSLAAATARRGDTEPALNHYERAIRAFQLVGAWSPFWITLRNLIPVLADLGLDDDAATLHGATLAPRTGPAPYGHDAAMMERTATTLLRRMGRHAFAAHASVGASLAEDDVAEVALQAVGHARETQTRRPGPDR